MKKTLLLITSALLLIVVSTVHSKTNQLSGKIINKNTGQPIPDANIILMNTNLGTVSRDEGYYFLENLSDSEYKIKVSVIGYKAITKTIQFSDNNSVNFELEPKPIEYDPVLVTATLTEHSLSNVTVSGDVLTRKRMKELTGNTTGELISSIGGIYSKNYDGFAGLNTPSIRGSEASQVLVLMDGIRINTAQGGGVDLNAIPAQTIERIEVIKGGHSALVGSDAVGGVINLISKEQITPKGFNYGINSSLGSFGTSTYSVHGTHQLGSLNLFASYHHQQSDGDFEYKISESDKLEKRINNDSQTDHLFLKGKYYINKHHSIQGIYHYLESDNGAAGNANPDSWTGLTPNARSNIKRNIIKLESNHQLTNRLRLKNQIGIHSYDYHYVDPDGWTPTNDLHENISLSAGIQGIYTINNQLSFTSGINYQKDELTSTTFKDISPREMKSVFGQVEFKHQLGMTRWSWAPAIRWDDYSDVGSNTSPKLGVMISTGNINQFSLKGNIGQSYRTPTFNDLYWPADAYTSGNPNLLPETGNTFDMGFQFTNLTYGLLQLEVMYFNNHIEDLIQWQAGSDYVWRPTNVGEANITGIESGFKVRIPGDWAYINIFYTKMKATDETDNSLSKGKRLIYRPDDKWDFLIGTHIGILNLNLNYRIASRSYTDADNSKSLDGYQTLNANVSSTLNISGLSVDLKLQGINLTDEMIFLNDGYPLPGREFRFSVGINY